MFAQDVLPKADIIFCRDCLVHLSNTDISRALGNFRQTGASILITTTFPRHFAQHMQHSGFQHWRPLNLADPPFCMDPEWIISEGCTETGYEDKSLGVYDLMTSEIGNPTEG
jgi:hypothetical protein